MKKYTSILIILIITGLLAKAQKADIIYFDEDLNVVKKSKAAYQGKAIQGPDAYRVDFYDPSGKKLSHTFHYSDAERKEMQGMYIDYDAQGNKNTQGNYFKNKKEGTWLQFDDQGRVIDSSIYLQDKLQLNIKLSYRKNGQLWYRKVTDEVNNTLHSVTYDSTGKVVNEVRFKGNDGLMTKYTSGGEEKIPLNTREEIEAEYPGGQVAWQQYLLKNLNPMIPIDNGARRGTYRVIVRFIVKTDGTLTDIIPETSFGRGMEQEAVRIIKNSSKWLPASQYGRKVNAYRRQPITFVVSK